MHERVFSDARVMRFVLTGTPFSIGTTTEFFNANFDHSGSGRKLGVIAEKVTLEILGFAGLMPCRTLASEDYEIGFVLRPSSCGMGEGFRHRNRDWPASIRLR
jgi:[ribosomal protein S5]-alanine N-acetyltransferase